MEGILDAGCGLDVRKEAIAACIISRLEDAEKSKSPLNVEIKAFKAPPGDLRRLKRWIEGRGRRGAAMEGAGVYRRPARGVLEGAFGGGVGIIAANSRDMRNARGKKSGKEDARRISLLLRAGALEDSFTPEASARDLRDPARHRKHIGEDVRAQKSRMERFPQRKGFKLPAFSADASGASGRNSPGALREKGRISPEGVRGGLCGSARRKTEGMLFALNGLPGPSGMPRLRRMPDMPDLLSNRQKTIEMDIDEAASEFAPQIEPLETIPGAGPTAAKAVIGETGADPGEFPAAAQFCPRTGPCPGESESAGKKKHENKFRKYLRQKQLMRMRLGNDPQKRLISLKILLEAASGARPAKSSGGRRPQNGGRHMLHAEEQSILQRRIL
ncbi:MAG: transposase [Clostridiales bacterium]|jgi:transposase|nr:transposase [Clostridiales bacterium]